MMARRPVRIVLVVLSLLATAGLAYRAMGNEQRLGEIRQRDQALDTAAEEALGALLDLRGSMYAYVAPNQGTPFWAKRVATLLDTLKQRLVVLDTAVSGSEQSMADSLDGMDQLTAADRRARQYADRGELLLAGDVLFTEVRDLLNAVTSQVVATRQTMGNQSERNIQRLRQEQAALAAGAVALWIAVALVFLPSATAAAMKEPGEWRQTLAGRLNKPPVKEEAVAPLKVTDPPAPNEPVAPPPPVEPQVAVSAVRTAADICSELSALSDVGALSSALRRASEVIGASGLIVWVTSADGSTLSAVATHGFDARMIARIGTIPRDSSNLTAAAFRDNSPRTSGGTEAAPAALAVSMCGPAGPVGVLSAELKPGVTADAACIALASIFAAQLATLTSPSPVSSALEDIEARSAVL